MMIKYPLQNTPPIFRVSNECPCHHPQTPNEPALMFGMFSLRKPRTDTKGNASNPMLLFYFAKQMQCRKCPQNKKRPTKNPSNAIIHTPPEYSAPEAAVLELLKELPAFDESNDEDAATVLAAANFSTPAVTVTGK